MMMQLLAETAANPPPDSFSTAGLLAILGGITTLVAGIGALVHGKNQKQLGVKEQKDRDSVTLTNNPLAVRMEDHFVTRREFDTFRGEVRLDIVDMKGVVKGAVEKFDERDKRYQDRMDKRDETYNAKMEAIASGAYEARRRIHEKVNNHGERLKSLEDRTPMKKTGPQG